MGPLDGVKVLDISRYGPGRYTSMILADLGADVIMVEMPRKAGQSFDMMTSDIEPHYLGLNRNKRSIALNFKDEKGRELFYRLVEQMDVLIEGARPGTLKRRGMDYETVSRRNPRLIYCSITGYGQTGPYARRAGHDINFAGMTGILGLSGAKNVPPVYISTPMISDVLGGTTQAAMAIMAALYARDRTGKGQYIDVSSVDGTVFYHWVHAAQFFRDGQVPQRSEFPTGIDMAWMNIYRAGDGKYFTIGCLEPWHWANLCRAVGREDLVADQFGPLEKQKSMYDALTEAFSTKTRDEWVEVLAGADVSVAPVYDFAEMFADPHLVHRGVTVEVEHPRLGNIRLLNTPFRFSGTPAEVRTRPPLWAEHTREVLGTLLGCSGEELDRLVEENVIE
ncbi:MAG: CoA transferase [Dehalococcoidia bacterium]|nr:CoA transferase [Dehalococcoidia bacterium]